MSNVRLVLNNVYLQVNEQMSTINKNSSYSYKDITAKVSLFFKTKVLPFIRSLASEAFLLGDRCFSLSTRGVQRCQTVN